MIQNLHVHCFWKHWHFYHAFHFVCMFLFFNAYIYTIYLEYYASTLHANELNYELFKYSLDAITFKANAGPGLHYGWFLPLVPGNPIDRILMD